MLDLAWVCAVEMVPKSGGNSPSDLSRTRQATVLKASLQASYKLGDSTIYRSKLGYEAQDRS